MKVLERLRDKTIYNTTFLAGVMLLAFIKPDYCKNIHIADELYNAFNLLFACLLIILLIVNSSFSKALIWVILFFGSLLFSTLVGSQQILILLKTYFSSICLCLMFSLYLTNNPNTLLCAFNYLHIYVYINLLTILLNPNGLYRTKLYYTNWFLGYKNSQIRTLLPILCISLVWSYVKYRKISMYYLLFAITIIFTLYLIKSANGLLGIIIFLALVLIFWLPEKLPWYINLITALFGNIYIIFAAYKNNIPTIMAYLLVKIGKTGSFNGRKRLWKIIIKYIKRRIIMGYGFTNGEGFINITKLSWASHAHNWILNILFSGGLILLLILVAGIIASGIVLVKYSYAMCSRFVLFALLSFVVMGINESLTDTSLLYPLVVFAMNMGNIVKSNGINKANNYNYRLKFSIM